MSIGEEDNKPKIEPTPESPGKLQDESVVLTPLQEKGLKTATVSDAKGTTPPAFDYTDFSAQNIMLGIAICQTKDELVDYYNKVDSAGHMTTDLKSRFTGRKQILNNKEQITPNN
jgi:hypothetical protein